jgi:hypothetical protein
MSLFAFYSTVVFRPRNQADSSGKKRRRIEALEAALPREIVLTLNDGSTFYQFGRSQQRSQNLPQESTPFRMHRPA